MFGFFSARWRLGMLEAPRHGRRLALALMVALVAWPAGTALADGGGWAIVVGPLKAHHGFKLSVTGISCAGPYHKYQSVLVSYVRSGSHYSLGHTYNGPPHKSGCKLAGTLKSGSMFAHAGKLVDIKLSFHGKGATKRLAAPKGCTGKYGTYRAAVGSGTLTVKIHPGVFGTFRLRKVKAILENANGKLSCQSTFPAYSLSGYGTVGGVAAFQMPSGLRTVNLYASGESPGAKLTGSLDATFTGTGAGLFSAASDLSSAHIGGVSPLLTGAISFTGTSSCPSNSNFEFGTLAGQLTLHDPVLGPVVFSGASFSSAQLAKGNAYCSAP